jgi:hypothetical protein
LRRSIVVLTGLLLVIALVGCGGDDKANPGSSDKDEQADEAGGNDGGGDLPPEVCEAIQDFGGARDLDEIKALVDELQDVDPPEGREAEWNEWVAALEEASGKTEAEFSDDPDLLVAITTGGLQFVLPCGLGGMDLDELGERLSDFSDLN